MLNWYVDLEQALGAREGLWGQRQGGAREEVRGGGREDISRLVPASVILQTFRLS